MMGTSTEDEKSTVRALAVEDERIDTPPAVATESVDSKDLDRAFVYLARQDQSQLDNNVDLKALRRKIDWRIIPVMTTCFGLQFLDKVLINVSLSPKTWKLPQLNCDLDNSTRVLWGYGKNFTLLGMTSQMRPLYSTYPIWLRWFLTVSPSPPITQDLHSHDW